MHIRPRGAMPFSVWLRKNQGSPAFTVRFSVSDGIGALRLDQMGAVTPTLRRSQLGGLTAEHLRNGRFMHFASSDDLQEYSLWAASKEPESLPPEQWIPMLVSHGGLIPKGWAPAMPRFDTAEEITDLSFAKGRLDLAMRVIKQRRNSRREREPDPFSGPGAPVGLVRHLRRTIDRQQQEIASLKAQLEMMRRAAKLR